MSGGGRVSEGAQPGAGAPPRASAPALSHGLVTAAEDMPQRGLVAKPAPLVTGTGDDLPRETAWWPASPGESRALCSWAQTETGQEPHENDVPMPR